MKNGVQYKLNVKLKSIDIKKKARNKKDIKLIFLESSHSNALLRWGDEASRTQLEETATENGS